MRLLDPDAERSQRRPIDRLFDSLAAAYGDLAVAVILSGTASDGSRGIAAIKSAGGMVIVQDPETAEFDGMPRSAVNTGLADLVLPIEKISEVLGQLAAHPARAGAGRNGWQGTRCRPGDMAKGFQRAARSVQVRLCRLQTADVAPPHSAPHESARRR